MKTFWSTLRATARRLWREHICDVDPYEPVVRLGGAFPRTADGLALEQFVGLDVEDFAQHVEQAHVEELHLPAIAHDAVGRGARDLRPPRHFVGELVGVADRRRVRRQQFGQAHAHVHNDTTIATVSKNVNSERVAPSRLLAILRPALAEDVR